ncbi:hypothetical protein DOY81_013240, partial [Sarcophaga bullata]
NLSIQSTLSGQISTRANSATAGDNVNQNNNGAKSPPALHHYPNNNLIGVESRFRRKYYNKTLFILLIVLIVLLLITVIVLGVLLGKNSISTICRSNECVRTAASLIYSMDEETDPCEDFYQFTCGRWSDEHPRPDSVTSNDWFRERQARIMRQIREFLRQNITDAEPEAVGKVKLMYKACMDIQTLEEREMDPLVHFLNEFQLPLIPSGLNLTLSTERTQKPLNRTINRIALGTPETDSALPFNNDDVQ